MADLEAALRLVNESKVADFHGPQPEARVESAEQALWITFPPTYRRFVRELGAGAYGSLEFFGVVAAPADSVVDAIGLTLEERERDALTPDLVVVGLTGMGEYYVLDLAQRDRDGEGPIVIVPIVSRGEPIHYREHVAADFGSYLLQAVSTWNEDHPADWRRGWPPPDTDASMRRSVDG
jgi:antitoxin YobK